MKKSLLHRKTPAEILNMAHLLTEPGLAHFLGPPPLGLLLGTLLFSTTFFFCNISQTFRIKEKKFFWEIQIYYFQNLCIPSHRIDWHFIGGVPKINEQVSQVS